MPLSEAQNIERGVLIPVLGDAADTPKHLLGRRKLLDLSATLGARFGRARRVDQDHLTASTCSLTRESAGSGCHPVPRRLRADAALLLPAPIGHGYGDIASSNFL
jgi:hypothetical protein